MPFHVLLVHLGQLAIEAHDLLAVLILSHPFDLVQPHVKHFMIELVNLNLLFEFLVQFLMPLVLFSLLLIKHRQISDSIVIV